MYFELIVFDSVLNIFRVLNTNHKLNDLTSKATTLKAFIPLVLLTLHPGLRAALVNQSSSIFTHKHMQATAVASRELSTDSTRGTDGWQEGRFGPTLEMTFHSKSPKRF